MVRLPGFQRSMVSSISSALKCRLGRVITAPPASMAPMAVSRPVPCISGGAMTLGGGGPAARTDASSSSMVSGTGPSAWADRMVICRRSFWVHITPLGMPVVPPV